jgi:hypothetical protein
MMLIDAAGNEEANNGHQNRQANGGQKVIQPTETGIEAEQEAKHGRTLFGSTGHELLSER